MISVVVNCDVSPVLNLKPKAEKFEETMAIKIIIKRITKALLIAK